MIFGSWYGLIRILVVGIIGYLGLILLLLISGKRTLSKLNAFDFVVTIAIGSTFSALLLSKDVPLAEGLLAFFILIFLQYAITWLSVRSPAVRRLVKSEPRLLYHKGEFLKGAMKTERVTQEEIYQAMRKQGIESQEAVNAVVLETDGTMSVTRGPENANPTLLSNVK